MTLFRNGNNEAFRVIYDRYRQRLFAYTRQMLRGSRQDAEDALQDVFVRAYGGLRTNDRELVLRAWLYRVAHNRCVDELRRPAPPPTEMIELVPHSLSDPIAQAERREALRRLIADVRALPDQQRSALLMRELAGMTYSEVSGALGVSVGAVKSLLVRARVGLAKAAEARDVACSEVRAELVAAHDRGARADALSRRHLRECAGCSEFRAHLRRSSRQLAALVPSLGPVAALAKLLGFGSGASGSAGAVGGGAAVAGLGTGGVGVLTAGAGHVATILAAAVVAAAGTIEIQHTLVHPHVLHDQPRVAALAARSAVGRTLAPPSPSLPAHRSLAIGAAMPSTPPATVAPRPVVRSTNTTASSPHSPQPRGAGAATVPPGVSDASATTPGTTAPGSSVDPVAPVSSAAGTQASPVTAGTATGTSSVSGAVQGPAATGPAPSSPPAVAGGSGSTTATSPAS